MIHSIILLHFQELQHEARSRRFISRAASQVGRQRQDGLFPNCSSSTLGFCFSSASASILEGRQNLPEGTRGRGPISFILASDLARATHKTKPQRQVGAGPPSWRVSKWSRMTQRLIDSSSAHASRPKGSRPSVGILHRRASPLASSVLVVVVAVVAFGRGRPSRERV